ncbi:hypothetical protein V2G26_007880 [Clonostachys chloroleuca]
MVPPSDEIIGNGLAGTNDSILSNSPTFPTETRTYRYLTSSCASTYIVADRARDLPDRRTPGQDTGDRVRDTRHPCGTNPW